MLLSDPESWAGPWCSAPLWPCAQAGHRAVAFRGLSAKGPTLLALFGEAIPNYLPESKCWAWPLCSASSALSDHSRTQPGAPGQWKESRVESQEG